MSRWRTHYALRFAYPVGQISELPGLFWASSDGWRAHSRGQIGNLPHRATNS
jgi:hypothetical protein